MGSVGYCLPMGMIGIAVIFGLLAAVVMVVVGTTYAVKSRENRVVGIVLAVLGLVMLLGASGFLAFAFWFRVSPS